MSHAERSIPRADLDIDLHAYYRDLAPSPTLHINEAVNRRWRNGETVYHLGFGESRFPVHPLLLDALTEYGRAKSYLAARGLPRLLDAVAAYYTRHLGIPFSESQVVVGPGSKGLIFAMQMAMSAELYLPSPSWVSYAPQAEMLGKRVRYIPSRVEDDYRIDLQAFDRMLADAETRQKILVINSPNNPTGIMLGEDTLAELAEFCRARNVIVMSDEIYFRVRGERPHRSIASFYPEGTIVLGGLSKHLSVGGWRLGVALLPATPGGQSLLAAVTAIASEIWSAVAAPVQHAAVVAYEGRPEIEDYTTTCSAIHGIRTRHLKHGLEALGVRCTAAEGAFYITPNFDRWREPLARRGVRTSDKLAAYLLDEHGIASLPCSVFGLPPEMLSLRITSSYLDMERDEDGDRILELYAKDPGGLMNPEHHPNFAACLEEFGRFVDSLKEH